MARQIMKSHKLADVLYDIRGPILTEAKRLEDEGFKVLKLNVGNTAPFSLEAPDELLHDVIINLRLAQGYCDSKGIFPARKAIMQNYQQKGVYGVEIEDIYLGNGVSELIVMAMQGLLNNGDEVLIPSPDYPLWTAAVNLAGGSAVHYLCDEQADWIPDIDDIESKITSRTRGIVVINPNNPTGSVYPKEILEQIRALAARRDLIVFSDEIYEKIVYDDVEYTSMATLCDDVLCISFNGLSKAYRAPGFRAGWMVISGDSSMAKDYREGLDVLSNMRLCSNVPAQFAIQAALGGYQSISDLVLPAGRLGAQRDIAWKSLSEIPGITCAKPKGALYIFPKIDAKRFPNIDDQRFVMDLLRTKKILLVHGSGFNCMDRHHFRVVFLPESDILVKAIEDIGHFLGTYRP